MARWDRKKQKCRRERTTKNGKRGSYIKASLCKDKRRTWPGPKKKAPKAAAPVRRQRAAPAAPCPPCPPCNEAAAAPPKPRRRRAAPKPAPAPQLRGPGFFRGPENCPALPEWMLGGMLPFGRPAWDEEIWEEEIW